MPRIEPTFIDKYMMKLCRELNQTFYICYLCLWVWPKSASGKVNIPLKRENEIMNFVKFVLFYHRRAYGVMYRIEQTFIEKYKRFAENFLNLIEI